MLISVVIPVYNESDLIDELYKAVMSAMTKFTDDFEVICVNDGSKDDTLLKLQVCHQKDKRFKVLNLSRNFGHQSAYTAGLSYAKGEYVAMMDGDLQDPPELIAEMYKCAIDNKSDVVYGRRTERHETFFKKLSIKLFHFIFNKLSNINAPANVGNFSVMNRKALEAFLALEEKNRYLPGLRFFIGFKQDYVDYSRDDRTIGEAKMNFSRLLKLALDALFSFSKLPIKICIYLGVIGIIFTLIGGAVVLYKKVTGEAITGWSSILVSMYFLGSVQLLFMGIIGEYVHRIFVETQNRPVFIVKDFFED
jgi:glycosyltransferase involved in cell wall biosynthesis